jgi:hypothetical protein
MFKFKFKFSSWIQPPPLNAMWAHHPTPSSKWTYHPNATLFHRRQIIGSKKVYKHEFEPNTYKVSNILLTTKLQLRLCLYSVFNIIILISAMHYQFMPKIS